MENASRVEGGGVGDAKTNITRIGRNRNKFHVWCRPTEMSEVQTLIEHWAQAIAAGDLKRAIEPFAPEATSFDVGTPLRRTGRETIRQRLEEWIGGYVPGEGPGFELLDLEVTEGGDTAYATCLCHVSGKLKAGGEVDMWVRNTLGLRKIDGQWRIAHQHMSSPIDFETMKAALDAKP
ncbi:MAG: YybH family protein [Fimbriimonas sp.]